MTAELRVRSLRVLVLGILVCWLCKAAFWVEALRHAAAWPLHDFFFPPLLQQVNVAVIVAMVALGIGGWAYVRADVALLAIALGAFALGALVLLLHQLTYNDATFVTTVWTALFGLWLHRASARPSATLRLRAGVFAQLLVALLFFGGLVGKLTPGYWDGSVMYGIYFEHGTHWSFTVARSLFAAEQVPVVARYFSRFTLLSELLLATLPLWPVRAAMIFASTAMIALVVTTNVNLLSVVGSLIAMCQVVLAIERAPDTGDA